MLKDKIILPFTQIYTGIYPIYSKNHRNLMWGLLVYVYLNIKSFN